MTCPFIPHILRGVGNEQNTSEFFWTKILDKNFKIEYTIKVVETTVWWV